MFANIFTHKYTNKIANNNKHDPMTNIIESKKKSMTDITYMEKKTRITSTTLLKMNSHNVLKGRLCVAFDKGYHTVQRWINTNDVMLTTADSLRIIFEELGITQEQALENYK